MAKDIYFADIETTAFKDNLEYESVDSIDFKLACCIKLSQTYDSIDYVYSFTSLVDFIDFLCNLKKSKQAVFYFHNLKFDSKLFLKALHNTNLFDIEIIKINSNILQISCFRKITKHPIINIKFIDSLSLLLTSVKALGKMVNLEKLDFNFDY